MKAEYSINALPAPLPPLHNHILAVVFNSDQSSAALTCGEIFKQADLLMSPTGEAPITRIAACARAIIDLELRGLLEPGATMNSYPTSRITRDGRMYLLGLLLMGAAGDGDDSVGEVIGMGMAMVDELKQIGDANGADVPDGCDQCGEPITRECSCCGKELCAGHLYDASGNLSAGEEGWCGACVDALREQAYGDGRYGVTQ